jgi:crotonobetainyl-CoA:carnitine CoA-transferase CaiB-like acyl-CoA transferase
MTLPLEGIKVLDLSRLAPGPFCTMILGDLGADILKVEGPQDSRRAMLMSVDERAIAYSSLERNKRSVVLNLKTEQARQVFYELAKRADVIVEEFRPEVVKRLGVDYDTIKELNPRLVYCAISGYGQDGPYCDLPGHDINYISTAGALGIIGIPGGPPIIPSNLVADFGGAGMNAVIGILAALMARERTGKGQHVDIGMADAVVLLMSWNLQRYFADERVPDRGNEMLTGGWPEYSVYETKDGKYVSIGCLEPWFYENLCRALGREDYIPHQFTKGEKRQEVFSAFREIFRTKTRDEWFDYLSQRDICVGKVYTLDELSTDPQLVHREMIVEQDHAKFGKVKQTGISQKLSETPGAIRSFGPLPGQHTEEILLNLGYTQDGIEELRKGGAIQ